MRPSPLDLGGVTVERDVDVPVADGTILRADVYRPAEPGPHPVLVQRTPYDKRVAQALVYQHPAWYARQGYVVVVQDTRGRFASDGDFNPYHGEGGDGADTIRWAARLDGTTGQVGTYGFSYPGAVQLLAAAEAPEGLACAIPGFTGNDFYDGWTYKGGAFNHAFILSWLIQFLASPDALRQGKRDAAARVAGLATQLPGIYGQQPLPSFAGLREDGLCDYFFDWLEHDTRDDYWRSLAVESRYDRIRTPCLHVGGWFDTFVEGTLKNWTALSQAAGDDRAQAQHLVIGPWFHIPWARVVGGRDFGDDANNFLDELQLRWFDHWLKGKPNRLLDEPPVRIFVMGANRFRETSAWPPPGVRLEDWYLRSSGRATSLSGDGVLSRESPADEPPDVFAYLPHAPVPSLGGRSCCLPDTAPMGAFEQTPVEIRNDVLIYSTPPLERDLEVIGTVELILHAATDMVDTDWTVKLVDVDEQGRAYNLCDGILRARFRSSLEHPTLLEPGRVYEYRIEVGSTANLFRRGHRMRIELSSSNFPHYDVNPNTGVRVAEAQLLDARVATQVVFHDAHRASRLRVPVLG